MYIISNLNKESSTTCAQMIFLQSQNNLLQTAAAAAVIPLTWFLLTRPTVRPPGYLYHNYMALNKINERNILSLTLDKKSIIAKEKSLTRLRANFCDLSKLSNPPDTSSRCGITETSSFASQAHHAFPIEHMYCHLGDGAGANPCRGFNCLGDAFSHFNQKQLSAASDENRTNGENIEVEYSIKRQRCTIISTDCEESISSVVFIFHHPKSTTTVSKDKDNAEANSDSTKSSNKVSILSTTSILSAGPKLVSKTNTKRLHRLGLSSSFASSVGATRTRSRIGIKKNNTNVLKGHGGGGQQQSQQKANQPRGRDDGGNRSRGRSRGRSTDPRSHNRTRDGRDKSMDRPLPSHKQVQAANRKKRPRSSSSGSLVRVTGESMRVRIKPLGGSHISRRRK